MEVHTMQNNKPNSFQRFFRKNGYYFVIGACALAIAVSGFFLFRGGNEPAAEETLSVPVTIEPTEKATEQPIIPAEDAVTATEDVEDAMTETPEEIPAETADSTEAEETVPVMRTVVQPVSGELLTAYSVTALSYQVTTQDWRIHDGIDLAADPGAPVCATEAGTVVAVYNDDYLGTTIEIDHDSGFTTVYSNLEEAVAVAAGQTVIAGDCIGTVGNTALLEVGHPSHLHFAVSCNGLSVDPAEYFA